MSVSNPFSALNAMSTAYSTEQARIRGTVIFTWSLMIIVVSLRFVARRLSKAVLWYDDWLIVPAALSATICFASAIWITHQWLGRDDYILSSDQLSNFLKCMLISEIGWASTVCIVKCSILAFYWRLFKSKGQSFCVIIWAFVALTICWGIAVLVVTVFQCSPFHHKTWEVLGGDRCLNDAYWFFVGSSIPHITTDITLIGLPMLLIWKLQMRRSQKALLSAIFGLGGIVTIVAIVRLVYLIRVDAKSTNVVISIANVLILTGVEVNMSIICACLPSLRPITTFISEKFKQLRKHKSTHRNGSNVLMDTLRPRTSATILPLSTEKSWADGHRSTLDSSSMAEMAAEKTVAEIDVASVR